MTDPGPYFDIPLNLPHASRIVRRLLAVLEHNPGPTALQAAGNLSRVLHRGADLDSHPPTAAMLALRDEAAQLGRRLVECIEADEVGSDRVGQCVRNLFECLALGQEGAALSLRAGEDPNSLQRPG